MMEKTTFDLVVLGGGPGGIEAAVMAAQQGLDTALVSNQKIGGRAVWGSLVPSKVWLTAASAAAETQHSPYYALQIPAPKLELENLRARIVAQSEAASLRYRQQLKSAGVTLIEGSGKITGSHQVTVHQDARIEVALNARHILIATGSEPVFSATVKPVPPRIFAPRHAATLPELPKSLLIIGGGVTGVEYAFAFAALGTQVTLLHRSAQLLPRLDKRIAQLVEHFLQQRYGVRIFKNDPVQAVRLDDQCVVADTAGGIQYRAAYAFLASGRSADLSFYDPAAISFDITPHKALDINAYCQTNHPHIYAVGDATGAPMIANRATMQGRVAVSHILYGAASGTVQVPVVEMAYTHPPVGQIGQVEDEGDFHIVEKSYAGVLKAHLDGETGGLLRLNVHDRTGQIAGAAAFGPQASELLNLIQVAMHQGIPYQKLRAMPLAHPTFGELLTAL